MPLASADDLVEVPSAPISTLAPQASSLDKEEIEEVGEEKDGEDDKDINNEVSM